MTNQTSTSAPQEPMVGAAALAAKLQISERTVKSLAAAGQIPSYRVGRQLRFDLAEVITALRAAT